jgi:kynureninase
MSTAISTSTMSAPSKSDLAALDASDPLSWTRERFEIPQARACGGNVDGEAVYFCGNSLGLLSKKGRQNMLEELDVWSTRYVLRF